MQTGYIEYVTLGDGCMYSTPINVLMVWTVNMDRVVNSALRQSEI